MTEITDDEFNNNIKAIVENNTLTSADKLEKLWEYNNKMSEAADKEYDELLKNVLDDDSNAYERLMLNFIIYSQTIYWEKHGIKPIWTTIDEMPALIKDIFN